MKTCLAYIRVSTAKQGIHSVSLPEQHDAIAAYATRNDIEITQWFEERVTAAKRGRPIFTQMLTALETGQAAGVVMHKIDRSARNLKDWADLGELIDRGVAVHFVTDNLDLASRGGRLSADIRSLLGPRRNPQAQT
jgi:site-specific DNA recombinase